MLHCVSLPFWSVALTRQKYSLSLLRLVAGVKSVLLVM